MAYRQIQGGLFEGIYFTSWGTQQPDPFQKNHRSTVRKGHLYLSAGPELILTGHSQSGVEIMVGDKLPDEAATIQVHWSGANEGDVLRLIVDGRAYEEKSVSETSEVTWTFASNQAKWCSVELRDPQKQMRAITNPIFFAGHSA